MKRPDRFTSYLLAALTGFLIAAASTALAASPPQIEVTVTNLTRGQIFSPAVVALHKPGAPPLFVLGQAAGSDLASVAEDAILDPLIATLSADPRVIEVGTLSLDGGPILPGETATLRFNTHILNPTVQVSLVGMLVTTNDGFYGVSGVSRNVLPPLWAGPRVYEVFSPAYDAGTEANTEECSDIPGPPCGNPEVRVTDGAEEFVHIHSGIYGGGDLDPAEFDWRNPVARITVRLVPNF